MVQITAFEDLNRREGLYDMYDAMGSSLENRRAFSQLMQRDGERAQALKDRLANFEADLAKRFG